MGNFIAYPEEKENEEECQHLEQEEASFLYSAQISNHFRRK